MTVRPSFLYGKIFSQRAITGLIAYYLSQLSTVSDIYFDTLILVNAAICSKRIDPNWRCEEGMTSGKWLPTKTHACLTKEVITQFMLSMDPKYHGVFIYHNSLYTGYIFYNSYKQRELLYRTKNYSHDICLSVCLSVGPDSKIPKLIHYRVVLLHSPNSGLADL